jgi:hypothetical protein
MKRVLGTTVSTTLASWLMPVAAWAAEPSGSAVREGGNKLGYYVWGLANVSYAGMRAQNHPSSGWRTAAFIFGFPGTLVSYFAVSEGSNRAYGIVLSARPPEA